MPVGSKHPLKRRLRGTGVNTTMTQGIHNLLGLARSSANDCAKPAVKLGLTALITTALATTALAATALVATLATTATPALAHHPFGGEAPRGVLEGVVSGIGHPMLGLDHLAFIIAVGLLAAVVSRGWTVPLAFLLAALTGTGIHLTGANLPAPELVISASVLLFGLLCTVRNSLQTPAIVALTGLAGIFHGYAYGEAVVGAEPTPLLAYLVGFTAMQGAIAFATYLLSRRAIADNQTVGLISVQKAGFAICGAGAILLGNFIV